MTKIQNDSGNALIFILIAIFLLGGLTVLLTRTGSQTDETGSSEKISLKVSETLRYAASIDAAVQLLKSRGCGENDINLYAVGGQLPVNPLAPPDNSCDVFHVKGAGLQYKKIPTNISNQTINYYTNWHSDQGHCIYGVGTGTTTCNLSERELRVVIADLKQEVCIEMNRQLGVTTSTDPIPFDSDGFDEWTTGRFYINPNTVPNQIIGDVGRPTAIKLQNKKAACFMDADGSAINQYAFYQVIMAR